MANIFDQFDEDTSVAEAPTSGGNIFDQFDEQPADAAPASPGQPEAAQGAQAPEEADEPTWWRKLWYNFEKGKNLVDLNREDREQQFKETRPMSEVIADFKAGKLSTAGLGDIGSTGVLGDRRTPEEAEEIRQRQEAELNTRLAKDFPDVHGQEGSEEGSAAIVGGLAKALLSPEVFLPGAQVGKVASLARGAAAAAAKKQATKELALTGAGYGGGYSALQQQVEDGEVDPMQAMQAAAIASVGGVAVGKALNKAGTKLVEKKAKKQLSKLVGRQRYYENLGDLNPQAATERAMNDLRISVSRGQELKDALYTGVDIKTVNKTLDSMTRKAHKTGKLSPELQKGFRTGIANRMQASADALGAVNRKLGEKLRRSDAEEGIAKVNALTRAKVMTLDGKVNSGALKGWGSLSKAEQRKLKLALRNGNTKDINASLSNPKINQEFRDFINNWRGIRESLRTEAQPQGLNIAKLTSGEHFPQVHKSAGSLRNSARKAGLNERKLEALMRDMTSEKGEVLPAHLLEVRAREIGSLLQRDPGVKVSDRAPGFTRQRNVKKTLTPEDMDDYLDPFQGIQKYVEDYSKDLHRRKFWGMGDSVAESVPAIVAEEAKKGAFLPGEAGRVKEFLLARFTTAEVPPNKFLRDTKNFTNLVLLGNPRSALTQLGDIGVSRYYNGTLKTFQSLFGPKWVQAADLGVLSVAQEMSDVSNFSGKALDKMLGVSGFRRLDRLGKDTAINASIRKYHNWAKTDEGRRKIIDRFENTFTPDEMTRVINTFAKNPSRELARDDLARTVMVHDLMQVQPTHLSELPLWYQQHPDGRILYSLKTFALKQMNLVHKTIWKEWQTGSKSKALINAARYGTIMSTMTGLTGFAKDALTGKLQDQNDFEYQRDVVGPGIWSMLSSFLGPLGNKYNVQKIGEERDAIRQVVSEALMPPAIGVIDSLIWSLMNNRPENATRYIPYAGPLLTDWID